MSDPINPMRRGGEALLGLFHVVLAVALIYALFTLWPEDGAAAPMVLLLVILLGMVGSFIHAATSFATYVGNQRLGREWLWWYLLRPFIGGGLALAFYLVIRGGFLSIGADSTDLNLYGVGAVSILAGMFSRQATDKLAEVFATMFQSAQNEERANKLVEKKEQEDPDC